MLWRTIQMQVKIADPLKESLILKERHLQMRAFLNNFVGPKVVKAL